MRCVGVVGGIFEVWVRCVGSVCEVCVKWGVYVRWSGGVGGM